MKAKRTFQMNSTNPTTLNCSTNHRNAPCVEVIVSTYCGEHCKLALSLQRDTSATHTINSFPTTLKALPRAASSFDRSTTAGRVLYTSFFLTLHFNCSYGGNHAVFFEGDLASAAVEAAATERLLAIYLHHDASICANVFATVVMGNRFAY